jgi:hypothetical protein
MRLYILYTLVMASIVIASVAMVPNVADRLRRWLIAAVAVFVVLPGLIYLIVS